jgi:hypothetical protein
VGLGDLETLIRKLYVEAAARDAARADTPISQPPPRGRSERAPIATIAVRTGLTPRMVVKLLETGQDRDQDNWAGPPAGRVRHLRMATRSGISR